ncbi:N-formylglutamate amidohydrolase [Limihaloglobus sulfuriphilus]|nr:N-formylglutamate amidohydrolase [Limihaloglobus sulfuriphilus]
MEYDICKIERGGGPVVAAAIHDGHFVSPQAVSTIAISEDERLREEDPYTGIFARICRNRIIANYSRFEVDLNRPREKAVYIKPEDAWGLKVWKDDVNQDIISSSLEKYDLFYRRAHKFFKEIEAGYGRFVVLDIHSYCHRRDGSGVDPAPQRDNPDINLGTGNMNRALWSNIIERFIRDASSQRAGGRPLDVRENIRFKGGYFSKWIHETFPQTGCCLAIEIKKIFMDEWSGQLYPEIFEDIKNALHITSRGICRELSVSKE